MDSMNPNEVAPPANDPMNIFSQPSSAPENARDSKKSARRAQKESRKAKRANARDQRTFKDFWPRSIVGVTALILAFCVGATLSGVSLYAYYDYRAGKIETRTNKFIGKFKNEYNTANKTIANETVNAKNQIEKALEPIRRQKADGETLVRLVQQFGPAVWFVSTLDEAGQPSVGSAVAVATDSQKTILVGSLNTVRSSTHAPSPTITAKQGNDSFTASLITWDDSKDLAVLEVDQPDRAVLKFAPKEPPVEPGQQIFALSGLGSNGGSAVQGFVTDVSSSGIQHNASIGPQFQGGPLINAKGEIVAYSSRSYSPLNFQADGVWFAPTVRMACEKALRCPSNEGSPSAG